LTLIFDGKKLKDAKYPALFESVFANFERDYEKPFFLKNEKLY
jgi:hypothetical protein